MADSDRAGGGKGGLTSAGAIGALPAAAARRYPRRFHHRPVSAAPVTMAAVGPPNSRVTPTTPRRRRVERGRVRAGRVRSTATTGRVPVPSVAGADLSLEAGSRASVCAAPGVGRRPWTGMEERINAGLLKTDSDGCMNLPLRSVPFLTTGSLNWHCCRSGRREEWWYRHSCQVVLAPLWQGLA